ncbi:MAG: substrate-binding domain-containing protein [bacterium]
MHMMPGPLPATNNRPRSWLAAAGMRAPLFLLALLAAAGCRRTEPERLRVLCGSSMAAPIQELGREFGRIHGIAVEIDLGGSETLLPKILTGAPADVYVCHDPFEEKVRAAGRWTGSVTVGSLQPVLAVRPGNPRGIRSVDDLQRPELKVGIGDPRYSTCGELFVCALRQRGICEAVMKQVVLQSRSTTDVANGLTIGPLDAAVIWNFSAVLYAGRLEVVAAPLDYPDVRVTVVGLTQSPQPHWRDAFLQWCDRPEARDLFRRHGYVRVATPACNSRPD